MKQLLKDTYNEYTAIRAQYIEAMSADDTAGMNQAREDAKAHLAKIEATGKGFAQIFRLYSDALERGNEYIDLSDAFEYRDEQALIDSFREYGIDAFTFSSTWSGAVTSAWAFTQLGCELQGMIRIHCTDADSDKANRKMRPAFLFRVC